MARTTEERVPAHILERYEAVIGLEVHVQLKTASKIFCACSTRFGDPPNQNVCPVCLGLPGTLPVLNRQAVELAVRAALALNCQVQPLARFARKNYFYPDLPKGYQISMYELPLARDGWLEVELNGEARRIGITRLHLEEDAAKALHEGFPDSDRLTYIDFNRCGVPLIEIVSEPDLRTPAEAQAYLEELRQVLQYIGVSDCNMEEGSLRCDANVSVRPRGQTALGTKTEVKNLNSFRYLARALAYEIERQVAVLEQNGRIEQETRLWNLAAGRTEPMRSKEYAHDYRYFPEPDLLPVVVSADWREQIRAALPELPAARRQRFVAAYGLEPYDARVLTASRELGDFFEATVAAGAPPREAASWIEVELLRRLKEAGQEVSACRVRPAELADLIRRVERGEITAATAKRVFARLFETGQSLEQLLAGEELQQITDAAALEEICRGILAADPENVARYRAGNAGTLKYFVGQVMRATRGRANPTLVHEILRRLLEST